MRSSTGVVTAGLPGLGCAAILGLPELGGSGD